MKRKINLKKISKISGVALMLCTANISMITLKALPIADEIAAENFTADVSDTLVGNEAVTDRKTLAELTSAVHVEEIETTSFAAQDFTDSADAVQGDGLANKRLIDLFPDPVLVQVLAKQLTKGDVTEGVSQAQLDRITKLRYNEPWSEELMIRSVVGLDSLRNLTTLNLSWNKILDITPLAHLKQLQELRLDINQITDIDVFSKLTNIKTLGVRHNKIKDLSVLSHLTNLRELEIGVNQITDINVLRHLTQLEVFTLERNTVRDITPLTNLTNLRVLKLFGNQVSDIGPLVSLQNLQSLDLGKREDRQTDNNITDFSVLTKLPQLDKLHLAGQGIAKLPPQVLRQVVDLDVSRSELTDLTVFLDLQHLEKLFLSRNAFEDVGAFAHASMPNLTELDLSVNHIIDLTPFKSANLPVLKKVLLDGQRYKGVPRVPHAEEVVMENKTRDVDGMLVEPSRLVPASKTTYKSPYMLLKMKMVSEGYQIGYQWDKVVTIGQASTHYTGKNEVYVYEHYPVNFIVDGEVYVSLTEISPGSKLQAPDPVPQKKGFEFIGWFSNAVDGAQWDFDTSKTPQAPLVLYAQFKKVTITKDNGVNASEEDDDVSNRSYEDLDHLTRTGAYFVESIIFGFLLVFCSAGMFVVVNGKKLANR